MGGGKDQYQKDAEKAQANAANTAATTSAANEKRVEANYNLISPFAKDRLANGLPFYGAMTDAASGTNAQAFAPGRAALMRNLGGYGDLPSGFKTGALDNYNEGQARSFDNQLVGNALTNEQSKQQAAQLLTGQASTLNPLGWSSAAMNGNQSVMNAPPTSSPWAGILGGVAQGAMSALPF